MIRVLTNPATQKLSIGDARVLRQCLILGLRGRSHESLRFVASLGLVASPTTLNLNLDEALAFNFQQVRMHGVFAVCFGDIGWCFAVIQFCIRVRTKLDQ